MKTIIEVVVTQDYDMEKFYVMNLESALKKCQRCEAMGYENMTAKVIQYSEDGIRPDTYIKYKYDIEEQEFVLLHSGSVSNCEF